MYIIVLTEMPIAIVQIRFFILKSMVVGNGVVMTQNSERPRIWSMTLGQRFDPKGFS